MAWRLRWGMACRLGLQTISSSKSAFITAMYVPLVPLLQWLCLDVCRGDVLRGDCAGLYWFNSAGRAGK